MSQLLTKFMEFNRESRRVYAMITGLHTGRILEFDAHIPWLLAHNSGSRGCRGATATAAGDPVETFSLSTLRMTDEYDVFLAAL